MYGSARPTPLPPSLLFIDAVARVGRTKLPAAATTAAPTPLTKPPTELMIGTWPRCCGGLRGEDRDYAVAGEERRRRTAAESSQRQRHHPDQTRAATPAVHQLQRWFAARPDCASASARFVSPPLSDTLRVVAVVATVAAALRYRLPALGADADTKATSSLFSPSRVLTTFNLSAAPSRS